MNYCNFAKVIIARGTKDQNQIDIFNSDKENNNECTSTAKYNNSLPLHHRFDNYTAFMEQYPKMKIESYMTFSYKTPLIQDYVTKNKYYATNNKNGEKEQFTNHFSLQNWVQNISHYEKQQHSLENCHSCNTIHIQHSILHKSIPASVKNVHGLSQNLVTNVSQQTMSRNPTGKVSKVAKAVVNYLDPVFEKEFGQNFQTAMAKAHNLSPLESSKEQKKRVEKSVREITTNISKAMTNNDNDVTLLLSTGKSYSQYERERLTLCFNSKADAEKTRNDTNSKESTGKIKPRKHHGKYDSYEFEKEKFLEEIRNKPPNSIVNWTRLASKYKLKSKKLNTTPGNGGQVLMHYAKDNGIDINKFNAHIKVSGRDILHRVRRSKKRAFKSRISIPTPRTGKTVKKYVQQQIEQGIINVGIDIAPKYFNSNKITADGNLTTTTTTVYGKKIPLTHIVKSETNRLLNAGVLRMFTDQHYESLTTEQIQERYRRIGEQLNLNETTHEVLNNLKTFERTRSLKMWHDHSDVLNHTYISFMVSYMYDIANFVTNEEYKLKHPQTRDVDVQSIVERPQLYILGQSGTNLKVTRQY